MKRMTFLDGLYMLGPWSGTISRYGFVGVGVILLEQMSSSYRKCVNGGRLWSLSSSSPDSVAHLSLLLPADLDVELSALSSSPMTTMLPVTMVLD